MDLVPEYVYRGERYRSKRLAEERRLVGRVDGFITACDSYADYYMERYSEELNGRRPVVRDNMPGEIVSAARPTRHPLRLIFLGSLMFDRPVAELIRAMSLVSTGVSLTFQGKNLLLEDPEHLVREFGLQDRVSILPPCPPDETVLAAAEYDVGVVCLRGLDENERRASTSKLFTYMSAGLAILGSDLPGIARIVRGYGNGILVQGTDPSVWAAAIDEVARIPLAELDAMKKRSLDAAGDHSWAIQKPQFLSEFVRVSGGHE
ncbi:glycosyltransferase [bacterium]|nr:glycosyltransferase [bacterium]